MNIPIWAMNFSSQSKLQTYATYKVEHAVEPYLDDNFIKESRLFDRLSGEWDMSFKYRNNVFWTDS